MKKVLTILMVFSIIFCLEFGYVYADEITPKSKPVKVKLNGELLQFDVDPIIYNDRTMVPMRAIFEYLGSRIIWYGDTKTVVGYKDNMYIKLQIGNTTAYKNGKKFTLDAEPLIRNSRTLVPVRFVAESFGMTVDWDGENRIVSLNYNDTDYNKFDVIDGMLYKLVNLKEYGLKFMIPDYFENSSESPYIFKYKDDEENIHMSIEFFNLDEPTTLDDFTEKHKNSIMEKFKDKIIFTGRDNLKINNNIDINVVYLKNSSYNPQINQAIYYIYDSNVIYLMTFSYYADANDNQLLDIFTNIVNSIEISDLTINVEEEHYIEYDQFFKLGIKLDTEIYSNMEVHNKLNFKGSVENNNLEYLFVVVKKDKDSMEFKVPVIENKFDAVIFTPFGLGKHNIDIGTPIDKNNTSQYIMQFSVINTSSKDIRYLIPSRFVEKDDEEIIALAKEITKDDITEYDKAKSIFEWMSENIEYDFEANVEIPRTAKETLTDKKGDCDEISYLYTALLRAIDIPAKLVSGKADESFHVWNEVYINGKWIIVDSTWGSGYVDGETYIKNLDMNFFNPDRKTYESKFTDIEYLPY